ncbi:hypothetical protein C7M84_004295 [Penaeus vannamei]|uniref:Uncharacterized protein n=1 Tax=Penaeus vannamei TaxID=6689 RepID=A0A3R7QT13_PENVA|nr:hypothetical protein C7M84_004295 [Penaeus vannamei]
MSTRGHSSTGGEGAGSKVKHSSKSRTTFRDNREFNEEANERERKKLELPRGGRNYFLSRTETTPNQSPSESRDRLRLRLTLLAFPSQKEGFLKDRTRNHLSCEMEGIYIYICVIGIIAMVFLALRSASESLRKEFKLYKK